MSSEEKKNVFFVSAVRRRRQSSLFQAAQEKKGYTKVLYSLLHVLFSKICLCSYKMRRISQRLFPRRRRDPELLQKVKNGGGRCQGVEYPPVRPRHGGRAHVDQVVVEAGKGGARGQGQSTGFPNSLTEGFFFKEKDRNSCFFGRNCKQLASCNPGARLVGLSLSPKIGKYKKCHLCPCKSP